MIYITGDIHRGLDRFEMFTSRFTTSKEDIMIILGDAGFNFYLNAADKNLKSIAEKLPLTFFCIHGNHEERPQNIRGYETCLFHGGTAFFQKEFPSLYFAKDGEFYDFNGKTCLVLGGAYSVDKHYRLAYGYPWFPSEQPDDAEKKRIEQEIEKHHYQTDYVFSHTCPYDTMPRHLFMSGIDQSRVDNSTEKWLQTISDKLTFERWFFGHYHVNWTNGNYQMLFEDIIELP